MKKVIIEGREITTNLGSGPYSIGNGKSATMTIERKKDLWETDDEFVARLVKKGYTRITLKYETTRVRGYHKTFAMCK